MSWRKLLLYLLPLLFLTPPALAAAKKKILLIGQGPDGHPKGTHEYMAGVRILAKCLNKVDGLEVTVVKADGAWKEGPRLLENADAVVLFLSEGAKWAQADTSRHKAFAKLAARKGGLVALDWAIGTKDAGPVGDYLKLLGGCHGGADRKYTVLKHDNWRLPAYRRLAAQAVLWVLKLPVPKGGLAVKVTEADLKLN